MFVLFIYYWIHLAKIMFGIFASMFVRDICLYLFLLTFFFQFWYQCVHARCCYSVMAGSLQPHGLQPIRLLCTCDFPGKDPGVGCHSLLQGIFLTQGLNLLLPHWQADSLPLCHLVSIAFQFFGKNFLYSYLENPHGQRSLASYIVHAVTKSWTTEETQHACMQSGYCCVTPVELLEIHSPGLARNPSYRVLEIVLPEPFCSEYLRGSAWGSCCLLGVGFCVLQEPDLGEAAAIAGTWC